MLIYGIILRKQLFSIASVSYRGNAYRASLGRLARSQYLRLYPVTLVLPDGATLTIRTREPRHIIQLCEDVNQLNETERRERLAARKKQTKKVVDETIIDDNFSVDEYRFLWEKQHRDTIPRKQVGR
jgi:large subunit ribosomal protein L55